MAVLVRSATPEDLRAMVELLVDGSLGPTNDDPSDLAPYADAFADVTASRQGDLLVAELDGRVVGVCQLVVFRHFMHRGGWCAELESVHVHSDYRSQGIGTVLITEAVARARRAGCYRVQLTSNEARVDAHRFYERLGFSPTHRGFKLRL